MIKAYKSVLANLQRTKSSTKQRENIKIIIKGRGDGHKDSSRCNYIRKENNYKICPSLKRC